LRLLQCGDRSISRRGSDEKIKIFNALPGYGAILTWFGSVSMVRAAFEGDGASFPSTRHRSGRTSMAEDTNSSGSGNSDQSSSDEAALSARLGSLDQRLS